MYTLRALWVCYGLQYWFNTETNPETLIKMLHPKAAASVILDCFTSFPLSWSEITRVHLRSTESYETALRRKMITTSYVYLDNSNIHNGVENVSSIPWHVISERKWKRDRNRLIWENKLWTSRKMSRVNVTTIDLIS